MHIRYNTRFFLRVAREGPFCKDLPLLLSLSWYHQVKITFCNDDYDGRTFRTFSSGVVVVLAITAAAAAAAALLRKTSLNSATLFVTHHTTLLWND
jgi:hypothetical protein